MIIENKKYHLFIDESGDPSLGSINLTFPVFILLGCLLEASAYSSICSEIDNLKLKIFGTKEVIFHSRDIRKCEGIFSKLFDLKLKSDFYNGLNKILKEGDYKIISIAIKKEEFIEKYGRIADDPYELSLTFLLERALMETDSELENKIYITAESRGRIEDGILKKRYNRLIDMGSKKISSERFRKRFERMEFKKKHENDCGLQIADLCAYPVARHIIYPKEPYPSFDIVEKKFRKRENGFYNGYGLKIFP